MRTPFGPLLSPECHPMAAEARWGRSRGFPAGLGLLEASWGARMGVPRTGDPGRRSRCRSQPRKTGAHRQALGKPYFNASARCELSYGRLRPPKHHLESREVR